MPRWVASSEPRHPLQQTIGTVLFVKNRPCSQESCFGKRRRARAALSFDHLINFRDLGGHPCAGGGRTRVGVLFRCGMPRNPSARDMAKLRELGVRTVIDLRGDLEARERPSSLARDGSVDYSRFRCWRSTPPPPPPPCRCWIFTNAALRNIPPTTPPPSPTRQRAPPGRFPLLFGQGPHRHPRRDAPVARGRRSGGYRARLQPVGRSPAAVHPRRD